MQQGVCEEWSVWHRAGIQNILNKSAECENTGGKEDCSFLKFMIYFLEIIL